MKTFILFMAILSTSAFAKELSLNNYINMQEALANDDFKDALKVHEIICEKDLAGFKNKYKGCSNSFKDIDSLRDSFKTLSTLYIAHGNKKDLKEYITAECSMAKAKWIQAKGALRNPYYGKSMLQCGQKI
jgi:hypothetical protein